jgi:DNA-binding IclR family transcriptional regulator
MNADTGAASSLERMLAILSLFTEHKLEWTSEELMQELGYSRPTLYRYLKSLRTNGMLASTNNASFTLGPKVVEMDFLLRRSDPLVLFGTPYLEELAYRFSGTAFLSRWYGKKVLCVEGVSAPDSPISSFPRGRPMPVGRGATARAILAFLPKKQTEALIEPRIDDFRQIGLGDNTAEVLRSLGEIRRRGVTVGREEVTAGIMGIAAPVFDANRIPIGSLNLSVSLERMTSEATMRATDMVREAAVQLSMKLADRRQRR